MPSPWRSVTFLLAFLHLALGTTVIVDDTAGDPVAMTMPEYSGCNESEGCGDFCDMGLNASMVYKSTFHDCTHGTMEFQFNGTSIYIYTIEYFPQSGAETVVYLDNHAQIVLPPEEFQPGFLYNYLWFNATGLESTSHNVTVQGNSLLLFDYASYTTNTSSSPATDDSDAPSREAVMGAIAGGVVAIVLALSVVSVLAYVQRRRNRRREATEESSRRWSEFIKTKIESNLPSTAGLPGATKTEASGRSVGDDIELSPVSPSLPQVVASRN